MEKVKQIMIKCLGDIIQVIRYDTEKQLLYQQNRSRDQHICLDDFIARLQTTKEQVKKKGLILEESHVLETELWPQQAEVHNYRILCKKDKRFEGIQGVDKDNDLVTGGNRVYHQILWDHSKAGAEVALNTIKETYPKYEFKLEKC